MELYRKRFIPNETIHLNKDKILSSSPDLILTTWQTVHPRKDIARGISAYYPQKGFKVSKVFDHAGNLVYWYCDIIRLIQFGEDYIFEDLLFDVLLYKDGTIHVLDIAEVADALESGIITQEIAILALHRLNDLLQLIYSGGFAKLQEPIEQLEHI